MITDRLKVRRRLADCREIGRVLVGDALSDPLGGQRHPMSVRGHEWLPMPTWVTA